MKKISPRAIIQFAIAIGAATSIFLGASSAFASTPVVSIINLTPSNTVSSGTNVTFGVATSGFINPSYSLSDTFVGGSLGSIDLNSAGEFSWTPQINDAGTHTVTITVQDTSGNEGTAVVTLNVGTNGTSLSVGSIYPSSSVTSGQTVSFEAIPSGFSGTPSYSVSDTFTGSTVSSSDINSSGNFSWTPTTTDLGTHTLTVTATDSSGNTSHTTVTLTVSGTAATTTTVTPTTTVVTAPATVFTEYLSPGSEDAQVMALQNLLISLGDMTATPTGYYGQATEDAVIKYQAAHGIDQLGVVGPATRVSLNSLSTTPATTNTTTTVAATGTTSTTSTSVSQIQTEIQAIATQLAEIESQISGL